MPVRRGWWLALLLCPAVAGAQVAALTTGGGIGRLDQSPTGAIGTIGLDAGGRLGPVAVSLASSTITYQDIGTTSRIGADVLLAFARQGWRAGIGPRFEFGNAVRGTWTDAWSGVGMVGRTLGPVDLQVEAGEGITHPMTQRVSFGRRGAELGLALGPVSLRGSIGVTVLRDSTLRDNVFFDGTVPPGADIDTLFRDRVRRISDVAMTMVLRLPAMHLTGTLGRRSGDAIATQGWWRVRALIPLTAVASVEIGANRNPADVVLGIPGGRETTLGLRVALPDPSTRSRPVARVVVEREDARHVRVVLSLPGGSRARLMGEITGWRAVELEPIGGGRFVGSFLAVPGTYRINVALDDGPWVAPPGMPRIEDGFGGMVGLLEL